MVRHITWKGNSVYSTRDLDKVLGFQKGDVYDQQLLEQYNNLLLASKDRPDRAAYDRELALAKLMYEAHWNMLEGLKSWNAFSAYGSDDLDFFKKEHLENAYLMFRKGSSDSEIIDFLVYRLADLYYVQ